MTTTESTTTDIKMLISPQGLVSKFAAFQLCRSVILNDGDTKERRGRLAQIQAMIEDSLLTLGGVVKAIRSIEEKDPTAAVSLAQFDFSWLSVKVFGPTMPFWVVILRMDCCHLDSNGNFDCRWRKENVLDAVDGDMDSQRDSGKKQLLIDYDDHCRQVHENVRSPYHLEELSIAYMGGRKFEVNDGDWQEEREKCLIISEAQGNLESCSLVS